MKTEATPLKKADADTVVAAQWWFLAVTILIVFADSISCFHMSAFMPDWLEARGLSETWSGLMFGVQFFGIAATTAIGPEMNQKFSYSTIICVTTLIVAGLNLVQAFVAPKLTGEPLGWVLLVIRLLMGLAEGFMQVTGMTVVITTVPEDQSPTYVGALEGMRALGVLVGPLFGGPVYDAGGWYLPFLIVGVFMATLAASAASIGQMLPPKKSATKTSMQKRNDVLIAPVIAIMLACSVAISPSAIIAPIIEGYMTDPPFNLNSGQLGVMIGSLSVIDVLAAGLSGPIVAAVGEFPVTFVAAAFLITGQFLLAWGPQTVVAVVLSIAVMYCGLYPIFISGMSLFRRICKTYSYDYKEMADVFSSIILLSGTISTGICTSVGGGIAGAIGFRHTYIIFGSLCVLIYPIYLIGFHPGIMGRPLAQLTKEDLEEPVVEAKAMEEAPSKGCMGCLCP